MGEAVTAAELLYGMPLLRSVTGGDGGGAEPGGCGALLAELKVCGCGRAFYVSLSLSVVCERAHGMSGLSA
jgi:hypothetical protein